MTKESAQKAVDVLCWYSEEPCRCSAEEFHLIQPAINHLIKTFGAVWPYKDEPEDNPPT